MCQRSNNSGEMCHIWEFPKMKGTVFWGPSNKNPTIEGTILGSPIFGNPHFGLQSWSSALHALRVTTLY